MFVIAMYQADPSLEQADADALAWGQSSKQGTLLLTRLQSQVVWQLLILVVVKCVRFAIPENSSVRGM